MELTFQVAILAKRGSVEGHGPRKRPAPGGPYSTKTCAPRQPTENDVPQPQEAVALGLRTTKEDPTISST